MKIAICDDDKNYLRLLSDKIIECTASHQIQAEIDLFISAEDFTRSQLETYDLVFLDVRIGTNSGIDAAKQLRQVNDTAILIFISAFVEYAIMGYSVHATAYLLKSDLVGTFKDCMEEVFCRLIAKPIVLNVPYEGANVSIPSDKISYIESHYHMLEIHTTISALSSVQYYEKLSALEVILSPHGFLRIYKSYLVNTIHCQRIQKHVALMDDSTELPCSRQSYGQILQAFLRWKGREDS